MRPLSERKGALRGSLSSKAEGMASSRPTPSEDAQKWEKSDFYNPLNLPTRAFQTLISRAGTNLLGGFIVPCVETKIPASLRSRKQKRLENPGE